MFGGAERYTIDRFGTVIKADVRGRTTSARTVQASQIFSQDHFRVYFMGIVKLAFVTPAMMRVKTPPNGLLMISSPLVRLHGSR
jgi:hypothetical protein